MILHKVIVNNRHRQINIRPFGDLQLGEQGFRKDLWQRWKRDTLEDKTALIIGMGDYSDRFRQTVDHKLRHALLDDDSAYSEFDYLIMKEMQEIAEELNPFKSRLIGLHEGHHFHKFANGTTSTQYLCQLLKTRYLDFVAGLQLLIRRGKDGRDSIMIDVFSTHGCGGSSYLHSDLANLERKIMPYWDVDIFLRGHSTKVYVVDGHPLNVFTNNSNDEIPLRILKKHRLLVNTGGFMESYEKDAPSNYIEKSNMPRCALGWAVINIHNRNNGEHKEALKISGYAVTE